MVKGKSNATLHVQVKSYDVDLAGIVHNSVYLCWLDDLRCAFLEKVQSMEELVKIGAIPVLARTDISYKRPIRFGDKVVAQLWLVGVGKIKWRIRAEFYVGNNLVSHAVQEGCFIDMKSFKPIELPAPFIRYWQSMQQPGESQLSKSTAAIEPWEDFSLDDPVLCPV